MAPDCILGLSIPLQKWTPKLFPNSAQTANKTPKMEIWENGSHFSLQA